MSSYEKVFENNRQWVAQRTAADPHFFEHLSQGQTPEFLYIGCADSRVPAATVTGLDPGELFVHRNVANLVLNIDHNSGACIQYAVEQLRVKHVVVCGHYSCGGVGAAMQSTDLFELNAWLRGVRDVYRLHAKELDAIEDQQARYDRLVELNVMEQCYNVIKTSWIQKAYASTGYPQVHGWVYDLKTGLLKDLEVPFEALLARVQQVYKIV